MEKIKLRRLECIKLLLSYKFDNFLFDIELINKACQDPFILKVFYSKLTKDGFQ